MQMFTIFDSYGTGRPVFMLRENKNEIDSQKWMK